MSNYLDAADTDDEDDKCTSIANSEDVAIAQERCRVLKGDFLHLICIYSTGEEESWVPHGRKQIEDSMIFLHLLRKS